MKKILFSIIALVSLLSSCSNDDIIVERKTTIKVNPSQVIAPFNYENEPGELESFATSHKLRVTLLAYNKDGLLKARDTQYLANYASLATYNLQLEKGEYDIVAITDVVEYTNSEVSFEYWKLSGENNILTTRMTDAGYIGGKYKIMGIARESININFENNDVILYPIPVGALCLVEWYNIHTFSDVTKYTLSMNRSSDFLQLNNSSGWDVTPENNNNKYDWRLAYLEPSDYIDNSNSYNQGYCIYNYYYCLPMSLSFKYQATTEEETFDLTDPVQVNLEAGKEYWFYLDLHDEDNNGEPSCGLGILKDGKSMASSSPQMNQKFNSGSIYIKDINKSNSNQ